MKGLGETRMAAIGIDVSKHNGVIDWEKIKASGINFAIIRIGHGSDIASQDDSQAERNMNECERLGIPYGVYIYSYALTEEEAESEAQHTLRMIEGRNPVMGVWFDMEDADGYKQKHGIPLDNAHSKLYTDICAVYTSIIQEKGYKAGIYASKSVLDTIIGKDYLQYSGIKIWVAQWSKECTYKGNYEIWQYTSDGAVPGSSARTDMNYFYGDIPKESKDKRTTSMTYAIGQHVVFSTCYRSSSDDNSKAIGSDKMSRNHGIITNIKAGARNPYLLDSGLCWVNDGDIRGLYKANSVYYYDKYTGSSVSLVEALQSSHIDSSMNNRKNIAVRNGITNYSGTAEQNTQLLNLLKQGKLIK